MALLKKLFLKKPAAPKAPPMPEWDTLVDMMYGRGLDSYPGQVLSVIYSRDRARRYVVLMADKGYLTYRLEKISGFDPEEWEYVYSFDHAALPATWQAVRMGGFFGSEDDVMRELRADPEYAEFF